jgi:hypothetical protein
MNSAFKNYIYSRKSHCKLIYATLPKNIGIYFLIQSTGLFSCPVNFNLIKIQCHLIYLSDRLITVCNLLKPEMWFWTSVLLITKKDWYSKLHLSLNSWTSNLRIFAFMNHVNLCLFFNLWILFSLQRRTNLHPRAEHLLRK